MAFAKKMMGFLSNLMSFSTKLPTERHEKIPVTFFTGLCSKLLFLPLPSNVDRVSLGCGTKFDSLLQSTSPFLQLALNHLRNRL